MAEPGEAQPSEHRESAEFDKIVLTEVSKDSPDAVVPGVYRMSPKQKADAFVRVSRQLWVLKNALVALSGDEAAKSRLDEYERAFGVVLPGGTEHDPKRPIDDGRRALGQEEWIRSELGLQIDPSQSSVWY